VDVSTSTYERAATYAVLGLFSYHPAFMLLINQLLGVVGSLVYVSHMLMIKLNYSINLQEFFG
jgi:hypothetical protein